MLKMANKYCHSIIQCQSIVKTYLAIRHARLACISQYWDKCIPLWWADRNQISQKDKKDKKKTKPTVMIQIKEYTILFLTLRSIKAEMIQHDYTTRRLEFQKVFRIKRESREHKIRYKYKESEMPKYKFLISSDEMVKLIESGFMEQLQLAASNKTEYASV
jgi:hypothetical protein